LIYTAVRRLAYPNRHARQSTDADRLLTVGSGERVKTNRRIGKDIGCILTLSVSRETWDVAERQRCLAVELTSEATCSCSTNTSPVVKPCAGGNTTSKREPQRPTHEYSTLTNANTRSSPSAHFAVFAGVDWMAVRMSQHNGWAFCKRFNYVVLGYTWRPMVSQGDENIVMAVLGSAKTNER